MKNCLRLNRKLHKVRKSLRTLYSKDTSNGAKARALNTASSHFAQTKVKGYKIVEE